MSVASLSVPLISLPGRARGCSNQPWRRALQFRQAWYPECRDLAKPLRSWSPARAKPASVVVRSSRSPRDGGGGRLLPAAYPPVHKLQHLLGPPRRRTPPSLGSEAAHNALPPVTGGKPVQTTRQAPLLIPDHTVSALRECRAYLDAGEMAGVQGQGPLLPPAPNLPCVSRHVLTFPEHLTAVDAVAFLFQLSYRSRC